MASEYRVGRDFDFWDASLFEQEVQTYITAQVSDHRWRQENMYVLRAELGDLDCWELGDMEL